MKRNENSRRGKEVWRARCREEWRLEVYRRDIGRSDGLIRGVMEKKKKTEAKSGRGGGGKMGPQNIAITFAGGTRVGVP